MQYEKLQNFCFKCGVVEHSEEDCEKNYQMKREDPSQPLYDAGLRARAMREKAALISYRPEGDNIMEVKMFGDNSLSKQSEGESKSGTTGDDKESDVREVLDMQEDSTQPDMMDISESVRTGERGCGKRSQVDDEEVNSPAKMMATDKGKQKLQECEKFVKECVVEVQEGGGSGSSRDTENERNSGGKCSTEDSSNMGNESFEGQSDGTASKPEGQDSKTAYQAEAGTTGGKEQGRDLATV